MADVVLTQRMLKRNPGRRLKGPSRWLHSYHHDPSTEVQRMLGASNTSLASELRPSGLGLTSLKKERRLSCSHNSPTLEWAATPRTLRSVQAMKGVVRTSGALDSPVMRDANLISDMWRCASVEPGVHRSFLRSLSGEGHDARHVQEGNTSIKASKMGKCRKYHKTHDFEIYSYKSPHWCGLCHNFIWGLAQQGMRCRVCRMDIHKHCYSAAMVEECFPSKKVIRQVFGVDLTTVAVMDDADVPKVVQKCVQAIESTGLSFKRIYGVTGHGADVVDIIETYNRGEDVDLSLYTDINIITGVLKHFLRELPHPVISHDAYNQIMRATAAVSTMESSGDVDYTVLSNALKLLPKAHYLLLKYLGEHLHRVVDHSAENLMTAHNLAVIMSPTLLRAPDGNTTIFKDTHLQQYFVECVITKHEQLFS